MALTIVPTPPGGGVLHLDSWREMTRGAPAKGAGLNWVLIVEQLAGWVALHTSVARARRGDEAAARLQVELESQCWKHMANAGHFAARDYTGRTVDDMNESTLIIYRAYHADGEDRRQAAAEAAAQGVGLSENDIAALKHALWRDRAVLRWRDLVLRAVETMEARAEEEAPARH